MVPPNGKGRQDHNRPQQAATANHATPPRCRIGRGAEVLEGNRGIARVAGRLANPTRSIRCRRSCQSAAIVILFHFFRLFMSTLLFLLAQLGNAYRCCSQLFSCIDLSFEDTCQPDWTEINIAKSKFSMLKSIEMRHPDHPSCKVQLHPAEEQDIEITFTLEENEEFVGFQFFEAKQGAQNTYKVKILHCS